MTNLHSEVFKYLQKELEGTTTSKSKIEWIPHHFASALKDFIETLVTKARLDDKPSLVDFVDDDQFHAFLQAGIALGRCMEADLQKIQELKKGCDQPREIGKPVIGLSGAKLSSADLTKNLYAEEKDITNANEARNINIVRESSWKDFEEATNVVLKNLETLESALEEWDTYQTLSTVAATKQMMSCLRSHMALVHAGLAPKEDYEKTFELLDSMFKKIFNLTGKVRPSVHLKDLEHEILNCAWICEKQPPLSFKAGDSMDLQIRIFGIDGTPDIQLNNLAVYAIHESDCTKVVPKKSPVELKLENFKFNRESHGVVVCTKTRVFYTQPNKRGNGFLFEKFWCIKWQFEWDSRSLECLSLPFNVRTGAPQLWPHTGAVVWYCWAARKDLYKTPFVCPKELGFDSVMSMLQALVYTVCPNFEFGEEQTNTLMRTLRTLKRTPNQSEDKLNMTSFVHDPMPVQGFRAGKEGGNNKFGFFNWFISTVNFLKLLKNEPLRSIFQAYVGYSECEAMLSGKPERSCIIRFSQNVADNVQSIEPYVQMVVQFQGSKEMESASLTAEKIKKNSLCSCLRKIKYNGNKLLLPEIMTQYSKTEPIVPSYKYKSMVIEGPETLHIKDKFEKLHISSSEEEDDICDYSPENVPGSSQMRAESLDPFLSSSCTENPKESFNSPDLEENWEPPSKTPLIDENQASGEMEHSLDDIEDGDLILGTVSNLDLYGPLDLHTFTCGPSAETCNLVAKADQRKSSFC